MKRADMTPIQKMYYNHKHAARRRGIGSLLTEQQYAGIMGGTSCEICKVALVPSEFGKVIWNAKTLDRVDVTLPYSITNTALLCYQCNTSKSNITADGALRLFQWFIDRDMRGLQHVR